MENLDKNKYLQYKKLVEIYEHNSNIEVIPSFKCIKCENDLELDISYYSNINVKKLDSINVKNGVITSIDPGYGSNYDLESFYICICDKCISYLYDKDIIHNKKKIFTDIHNKLN